MKLIRYPVLLFVAQVVLVILFLWQTGRLQPQLVPDTASYEAFPLLDVRAALQSSRTCGYPLFIDVMSRIAADRYPVPLGQFLVHVGGVIVFWAGVSRFMRSAWTSMFIASSLLYSNVVLRYINCLAPDSLASSISVICIGCLLLAVDQPQRLRYIVALACSVFAAYQCRPAYLFLVPLLPLLGVALWWLLRDIRAADTRAEGKQAVRFFGWLATGVVVPLIVFCAVRWWITGDFGLVAFGGNNLAGVVTSFLDQDVESKLPSSERQLAQEILRRRQVISQNNPDFSADVTRSYITIERQFDVNTWEICVPVAQQLNGEEWPVVDDRLMKLAMAIVRVRPGDYAVWLIKAFVRGVYMISSELVANPIYFVLLMALIVAHAVWVVRWRRGNREAVTLSRQYILEINMLWLLAVGFAGAKIVTVIATTPPLGRFMDAAGIFFAPVLVRALLQRVRASRSVHDRSQW